MIRDTPEGSTQHDPIAELVARLRSHGHLDVQLCTECADAIERLAKERDAERYKHEQAITINERLLSDNRIAVEQLVAAQADNARLREALGHIANYNKAYIKTPTEIADEALATQPNHTALDARLKEEREYERERIAKRFEEAPQGTGIAAAIRSLT